MWSIRHFLTLLLIASLTLIIFSAAIHGYRSSMAQSSELFDTQLNTLHQSLGVAYMNVGKTSLRQQTNVAVQLWENDHLLVSSQNAPQTPIAPFEYGFSEQNFSGLRWRVLSKPLPEIPNESQKWLLIAQPLSNRFALAETMILSAMAPLIISIPVLALIIFLSVSRGLKPLKALSSNLSHREGNDLSQVVLEDTPSELKSVIKTLNSVFSRLSSAFEREQQFASNAAHELRTPLSVLKINLHNLAQELPSHKSKISALQGDTDRMIHVVNQILLLSRTNPEFFRTQLGDVDCYAVCQQVIADLFAKIDNRQQTIELDGENYVIRSTEFTFYTLVQNLVGNASKYSPEGAQIRVELRTSDKSTQLVVEDSGPGLAEHEYHQVMGRFYRSQQGNQQKSEGSGLGLAIVQQIVALHHGEISLAKSTLGGLKVTVTLPSQQEMAL